MAGTKGRSGRKPKPTTMKKLEGNPGHRPLPNAEPKPRSGILRVPAWLKGEGRKEWRRILADVQAMGVATPVDTSLLAIYCQLYGEFVEGVRNKQPVSATHIARMHALAAEFGIGASSRSRLEITTGAPPSDDEKSEFEHFRDRRRGTAAS